MDRAEYQEILDQIQTSVSKKDYQKAYELAQKVDWRRVKSLRTLNMIADVYEYNKDYAGCKKILLIAKSRASIGKGILYRLVENCVKLGEIDEAKEYYKQYEAVAGSDSGRYLLKYEIGKAANIPIDQQIALLEKYKEYEYTEKWSYELAVLYSKAGNKEKCVEVCDDMILWFSEGKYVLRAMELKQRYAQLTPSQLEYYNKEQKDSDPRLYTGDLGFAASILAKGSPSQAPQVTVPKIEIPPEYMEDSGGVMERIEAAGAKATENVEYEKTGVLGLSNDEIDKYSVTSPIFMGGTPDLKTQLADSVEKLYAGVDEKGGEAQAAAEETAETEAEAQDEAEKDIVSDQLLAYAQTVTNESLMKAETKNITPAEETSDDEQIKSAEESAEVLASARAVESAAVLETARAIESAEIIEAAPEQVKSAEESAEVLGAARAVESAAVLETARAIESAEILEAAPESRVMLDSSAVTQATTGKKTPADEGLKEAAEAKVEEAESKEDGINGTLLVAGAVGAAAVAAGAHGFAGKPESGGPKKDAPAPTFPADWEIPDPEETEEVKKSHTIPLGKIGQNTVPIPIDEVIRQETPEERRIRILNNASPTKMSDEQRKVFTYFSRIPGMDTQILEAVTAVYKNASEHTSKLGNIAIMGASGMGKTRLTYGLIVMMCKDMQLEAAKIARISGERLNDLDPAAVVAEMSGGFLAIENAGDMQANTVNRLNSAMEFKTDRMVVILEDEKNSMRALFRKYPAFAEKFNGRISIPAFTNDELVTFARTYCAENNCELDEMGVLALYTLISNNQTEEQPVSITTVKEMVDGAIAHARRAGRKNRKGPRSKTIVLYEKDFMV